MSNFLRKIRPNVFQVWFGEENYLEGGSPFILAVLKRRPDLGTTEIYRQRYAYPVGNIVRLDKVVTGGVLVTAKALAAEYRELLEENWERQQQAEIESEQGYERYLENIGYDTDGIER